MTKPARNRLTTLPKRELATLVADNRAFDVRAVRGALEFFNGFHALRDDPTIPTGQIIEGAYSWLRPVLEARAKRAEIDVRNVEWKGDTDVEILHSHTVAYLLLCSNLDFGRNRNAKVRVITGRDLKIRDTTFTTAEWFTRNLAPLPIHSRFLFDGSSVRRAEVPLITSVQRALAYAIAVLLEDRWQVRDRVRRCPYERRGTHFFLDYRTDDDGRFLPGEPMKYCCAAHSNNHRQQLWRETHRIAK